MDFGQYQINKNIISFRQKTICFSRWNIAFILITFLLLFLGMRFFAMFAVFAFVLNIFIFLFLPTELIFCDLFFLLSLASIYKYSPGTTSFFTLIEIYAIVLIAFREKKFDLKFLISLSIFICYILLICLINLTFDFANFIKQIMNIIILYFFVRTVDKAVYKSIILFYVFGVVAASIIGLFSKYIPNFYEYIQYVNGMVDGVDHTRFTGLSGDPNYYSVNLILSFSGIILLNYRNELKFSFWLLFACLTIFGLLTLSKSFILMYFFVCIMLIYTCVKKRKFFVLIIFCIAFIIILTLGILGVIPIVNSIVERLTSFDDFNSLTTGRFNLWKMYLNYFDVNINTFILGNGILVRWLNDKAAHNTYIDYLYYLGLVGTILNLICWKVCFLACEEKRKLKLLNLCGITIIIIMYFFLSMFFAYDLIFHVMIAWIYFKMDLSYSKKQCDLSKTSVF